MAEFTMMLMFSASPPNPLSRERGGTGGRRPNEIETNKRLSTMSKEKYQTNKVMTASQIHSTPSLQGGRGVGPELGVSSLLIAALMRFEGLRLEAYRDAAGVWTIGYGHTKEVKEGDKITEYWARELLKEDVEKVTHQVLKLGVCQTQGQLDALVSFTFNLGINRLRSSTLLKVIRKGGSAHQIQKEFKRWVYCNGKILKGLEERRAWEASRFLEAE